MDKINLHRFLQYYGYLMLVVLNFCVIPLYAQLPYSDTFKSNKPADLIISGATNGATLTSGSIDAAGDGYLRLTNSQMNQSGYVQSTKSFPSADGLSISFEYFTYGGTGADGITFFLYDATAMPFNIGTFGGSLGYAQNAGLPGVSKGFLALGLDEFGNFSNPTAGRVGGPGRIASSVVLRGDGNGLGSGDAGGTNYKYLKGISTNNTLDMAAAGAGGIFHVAGELDGRTVPGGLTPQNAGYRKAKMEMLPNGTGTGFILNVWITEGSTTGAIVHHVIKNYSYIPFGSIPLNLSYGFSASTGGATNFHEIRNLEIIKPIDPSSIPSLEDVNVEGVENVDLTFKASDFSSKFSQNQSLPLTKIKIQNLPKYGVLKLNGVSVNVGQEIDVDDIAQLKFVAETDFSGNSSFQWNGSDGNAYASSDAFVNITIKGFNPSFPYLESFMKASASGLIKRGSPNPAELTSGTIDPANAGYLRLTRNEPNQTSYAYSTKDFPFGDGLSISFDYYMHGASGDGISFFLFDAAANPFSIGAFGGSLGYTQNHSSGGVSKAFIGLGIDEFGNFSNSGTGRQGGPGKFPSSITLRGDGDGSLAIPSNYEYLVHTQTTSLADMSAIGADAGSPFQLSGNTDGRTVGNSGLDPSTIGYRRIKIDIVPNELAAGFLINVWITEGKAGAGLMHQIIKDYNYVPTSPVPAKLRYGFSAGNGNTSAVYEIRNLEILLPSNKVHKPILRSIEVSGFEDQDLVFQLNDFEKSFFDPTATNTLENIEFTSLPLPTEGVLKLDGVDLIPNQKISVSDISSGKLKFSPASDLNGRLASFKWNGYTKSNDVKADLDEEVLINLIAVNDSPLGEDAEILVGSKENILAASNFKLSDPKDNSSHTLKAVKITNAPLLGSLKLDNTTVTAGQLIDISAINSGKLTYTPALNETGKPYTSFSFQVQDNGGLENGGDDLSQIVYQFKINVAPIPVIELENANLFACIGSASASFNYNSLIGDPLPNTYSIDWDAAANTAGLIDITDKDLLPGAIAVENISTLAAGLYHGFLTVRNKNNDILSKDKAISLTIRPLLRAEISYGTEAFCANGKTMVTLQGDSGGKFTSSAGLIINELTGEVNLTQSAPGTYTVSYTLSNEACTIIATAPLIIKAMPVISAITGPNSLAAGSTIQLVSATSGGIWTSTNMEVLTVNSAGLVSGLKKGEARIFYKVDLNGCIDSVSFQVSVSQAKASAMSKLMNENKSISFSSTEFYDSIDSASRASDPSKSVINRIRIESLPLNGELRINGVPVSLSQEILYADISGLMYSPAKDFAGTDVFKWNWADASGKYGDLNSNIDIAISLQSYQILKSVNENEIFADKTSTKGRKSFTLGGPDAAFLNINSSNGEFTMKSHDFESPEDSNSDNIYEFTINSLDDSGNSYTENWKLVVLNVKEISNINLKQVDDVVINENLKYTSEPPVLNGTPIGKLNIVLIGKDSSLFSIDTLSGSLSMEARDFENPTDSDKDNVYEIGWRATDSDLNTTAMSWRVKIADVQKLSALKLATVSDIQIDEKAGYTSSAMVLYGESLGKITYSLFGRDAGLFSLNELTGAVSMPARDFDSPLDSDRDNTYEVRLLVENEAGNKDSLEWRVTVRRIPSSSAQSVLSPDSVSLMLDKDSSQILKLTTKYSNGKDYLKGGEAVAFHKISGSASIGDVKDNGDGTYTATVYSGSIPGRSVFRATLGGSEVMNGSNVTAQAVVDFVAADDNRLEDFQFSKGSLSPQFNPDIFNYSLNVGNFANEIFVNPVLKNQNTEVKINGIVRSIGESQVKIPLKIGENSVSISTSSKNGQGKQVYTIVINRAVSTLPYQESFANSTADGLVLEGFSNQAKLTSGNIDAIGKGYLRLTNNQFNDAGFVYNSQKFSSAKGLTISFEYFSHSGTGGNGLSFYLFDALANFSVGAFGGSLGYAQSSTSDGLSKGFIGLGLDEFGEFSSTSSSKQGGPGRRPSSVVLRGDGDGRIGSLGTNYEYLTGLQTTDAAVMKIAGAGNKFSVFGSQDGRTFDSGLKNSDVEAYRKAKIELVPLDNKTGYIINVWITEGTKAGEIVHHVIKNYTYVPTEGIPMDLKYGFAANNGNFTNIYEVRNLEIDVPKLSESPDLKPDNGEGTINEPVDEVILPLPTNMITPNGDGINDTWVIRNIEDFSNSTIRIFNRSGQEVYKTDNYKNDWDGRRNGNLLPTGTYYYTIESSQSRASFKGYITIL